MLHQQKKYREPRRHDLQRRVRCVLRHILTAGKTDPMPQPMRPQGLSVGEIGGDSRRYDIRPETPEPLDIATAGRAVAWEEAEWTSPLPAIYPQLQ
jgi:hypothetical protein